MKTALLVLLATLAAENDSDLHARAERLHRDSIVVDTHEDVPERLGLQWDDF
jgi:hypothetical protein